VEYFQKVGEENFTLCIRDLGSEQDENKAGKCRQQSCDTLSKDPQKRAISAA